MATYKHLRSSTANKRPTTSIADGQLAINTNTASPGLFFKDSAGTGIVKVGPVHVGTTAPNSVPAGSSGNYKGEQWLDTSVSPAQMKVWNGSTWVGIVADELPVSKLQDGSARQLIQTDATGTGVEWTSSINLPGTLDVTGASTLDSTLSVAGVSSFASGSAAAPSLTFTGDTNTGIYRPGADQVAISTNGTGRLFINSTGNIGIGATNPPVLLALESPNPALRLTDSDATGTPDCQISGAGGDLTLEADRDNEKSDSLIAFRVDGSERLRITSDGKLGLGTSSPGSILEISQNAATSLRITRQNAVSNYCQIQAAGTNSEQLTIETDPTNSSGAASYIDFKAANASRMRINGAGNVGIGTTSPTTNLHVASATPIITIEDTSGATANIESTCLIRNNDAFEVQLRSAANVFKATAYRTEFDSSGISSHQWRIGNSEKLRLDSSGRLLVGTSSSVTTYRTEIVDDASLNLALVTGSSNSAGNCSFLTLRRSRGTTASPSVVSSGDLTGVIDFRGYSGAASSYVACAQISAAVDGTPDSGGDTTDMPGRLVFSTTADGASSPTERMRIDSKGTVKISKDGTYLSTDSGIHEIRSNLDDNSALIISSAASNGAQYGLSIRTTDDQNDATRDFLECRGGATLRAQIRSNGGIANYSANDVNLSDRNVKKDITSAAGTWNCLKEWEIVNFRYKDQPDDADLNMGVIAQQVAESCPEVVTVFQEAKEATGNQPAQEKRIGVKEQQMMWMAVKALQEAQIRIETLEAEVAALKGS